MLQNDSLRALPDGSIDIAELTDSATAIFNGDHNLPADHPTARGNLDASGSPTIKTLRQQCLEHAGREHEY
jgi:hypothetical protein